MAAIRRYGFFKNKRIVLYDTLIEQCREPEVVAVLAHELGRSLVSQMFLTHFHEALSELPAFTVACKGLLESRQSHQA